MQECGTSTSTIHKICCKPSLTGFRGTRSNRRGRAWTRLALQGGCGLLDLDVGYDEAGHFECCACFGAPLSQLYGEALEDWYEDDRMPSRNHVLGTDVYAGFGARFDRVQLCRLQYVGKPNGRRSVSGTVITLGGMAVRWASSTQRLFYAVRSRGRIRRPG